MLSDLTLVLCREGLAAARDQNERDLRLVVGLTGCDLSNPACRALVARKEAIQAAYGEVVRAIEAQARSRHPGEDPY